MGYVWDFSAVVPFFPVLLKGLLVTFKITFFTLFFSTLIGVFVGIYLNQSKSLIKKVIHFILDFFKAVPMLILILWFYFLIPELTGLRDLSAFTLVVIAMTTNVSAFMADFIRAGINNIPKEHIEAGRSLGLTKFQVWRHIILPEVIHNTLPMFTAYYIFVFIYSSLASSVSVYELTHAANKVIMLNFRSLEVYTIIAIMYAIVVLPFYFFARKLEKKSKKVII